MRHFYIIHTGTLTDNDDFFQIDTMNFEYSDNIPDQDLLIILGRTMAAVVENSEEILDIEEAMQLINN